eukprot:scaffold108697_cov36-Phaeocystis_antarctica.AAC.1
MLPTGGSAHCRKHICVVVHGEPVTHQEPSDGQHTKRSALSSRTLLCLVDPPEAWTATLFPVSYYPLPTLTTPID